MPTHAFARLPRPRGPLLLGLLAALALSARSPAAARAEPPGPSATLTPEERVSYWLDRLLVGPEETTWAAPHFHQLLLADAVQNLAALGEDTLARLDDERLQHRVQNNPEANGWHAVLSVLAIMVSPRPETVRAWAVPALEHELHTLRRQAAPVLAQLGHPADAPLLLAALRRDGADGFIAGAVLKALLMHGPPWDAEAARVLLDVAIADQAGWTSGLWSQVPVYAAMAPGGTRTDLLAWWALLTEASGPRQRDLLRSGARDPRSIDPTVLACVAIEHAWTTGRLPAAQARAALARLDSPANRTALEADLASDDPALAGLARERLARRGDPEQRARVRANVARIVRTLETLYLRPPARTAAALDPARTATATEVKDGEVPPLATVSSLVSVLAGDESPEAAVLLRRILVAPVETRAWGGVLRSAYQALELRGDGPEAIVAALLASGEPESIARGLAFIRDSKSPAHVLTLEAWLDRPESAPYRFEARRLLVYLHVAAVSQMGIAGDRLAAFARRVAEWAADPKDPSAGSLAGSLLDLGPPGEAQFVDGLRGPRRAAFVAALTFRPRRYLGPELVGALLGPVSRETPVAERRRALVAALAVASSESTPAFDALKERLAPDDREDVEWVRRIVSRRARAF